MSLRTLARLYGVQTAYYGINRQRHEATAEALLATLRGLGAPLETVEDVPTALREKRIEAGARMMEPVIVARQGESTPIELRLPAKRSTGSLRFHNCSRRWEPSPRHETIELASNRSQRGRRRDHIPMQAFGVAEHPAHGVPQPLGRNSLDRRKGNADLCSAESIHTTESSRHDLGHLRPSLRTSHQQKLGRR